MSTLGPKASRKAGFSARAFTVDPGRDNESVVSMPTPSGKYRSTCTEGFPRAEFADGSSLFFIVQPFASRL
ncbi:MAG: hypothetical protein AAFP69_03795, partial [Planctomycetota bacterium]